MCNDATKTSPQIGIWQVEFWVTKRWTDSYAEVSRCTLLIQPRSDWSGDKQIPVCKPTFRGQQSRGSNCFGEQMTYTNDYCGTGMDWTRSEHKDSSNWQSEPGSLDCFPRDPDSSHLLRVELQPLSKSLVWRSLRYDNFELSFTYDSMSLSFRPSQP